jgi:hypothetical protein
MVSHQQQAGSVICILCVLGGLFVVDCDGVSWFSIVCGRFWWGELVQYLSPSNSIVRMHNSFDTVLEIQVAVFGPIQLFE